MKEKERLVYFNDEFIPERDARISIFDSALMFGDMIFEITCSFNKVQFKLDEHIKRLYSGIKMLEIPLEMNPEKMEQAVFQTIEANDHLFSSNDEHRVMIDVSRGPLSMYARLFGGKIEPTVVISVFPFKWTITPIARLYDTGVHAVIPSQRSLPAALLEPKIKSRSRMHYVMANLEISQLHDPSAWALMLDQDGYITEGTGSNFFIVRDGKLLTPEPRNILRGIRRKYTIELARKHGIEVIECNLNAYDAITAEEAFFTSTAFTLMPCVMVNGLRLGDGKTGTVTKKLIGAWNDYVGLDYIARAREYLRELDSDA